MIDKKRNNYKNQLYSSYTRINDSIPEKEHLIMSIINDIVSRQEEYNIYFFTGTFKIPRNKNLLQKEHSDRYLERFSKKLNKFIKYNGKQKYNRPRMLYHLEPSEELKSYHFHSILETHKSTNNRLNNRCIEKTLFEPIEALGGAERENIILKDFMLDVNSIRYTDNANYINENEYLNIDTYKIYRLRSDEDINKVVRYMLKKSDNDLSGLNFV